MEKIEAIIRKEGNKWVLYTHDGKKKLGTFPSHEAALKRERQIQFFKHQGGSLGHVLEFIEFYGHDFEPADFKDKSVSEWVAEARNHMMEDEEIVKRMMNMSPEEHAKLAKELGPAKHARLMRLMRQRMGKKKAEAANTTVQSVIVKKSCASTREEAIKKAGKDFSTKTSRETANSWRFRQRPPSDFDHGSFRIKVVNGCISLVIGKLKGVK